MSLSTELSHVSQTASVAAEADLKDVATVAADFEKAIVPKAELTVVQFLKEHRRQFIEAAVALLVIAVVVLWVVHQ